MTPDDWRRLADIFRVSMMDPYEPWRPFHKASALFREVADRLEREGTIEDATD